MNLWERLNSVFWSEWFWLPRNTTWATLKNYPGSNTNYPETKDLLVTVALALVLYLIRQLYEKFIVQPFGVYCGLKCDNPRKAPQNDVLEREYSHKKTPDYSQIQIYAKRTDLEVRQVERWFRLRRNQDRPTIMKKFKETGWRFTYYLGIFTYGITVLWDKPWLWDSRYCWIDFPYHNLEPVIYWYYMIELGFYISLMFSQFLDVKRKDFFEMFVHHIATISLLSFSYVGNFVRMGTLVLCIHDCADFWIEGAKMAKYVKAHRLCDVLFGIFAIVWFVTRLVCYPLKVLNASWYQSIDIVGFFPSLIFFNGWLCLLLVLHTYWFSLIVRVAYSALTKDSEGPMTDEVDDVRSSTEEQVSDEPEQNHVGNNVANHNHTKAG